MKRITIYLLTFLLQVVLVLGAKNLEIRTFSGLTYRNIQIVEIREDSLVLLMNSKQYAVALSEIETVHESLHPRPLLLIAGGCALGLFLAYRYEYYSSNNIASDDPAEVAADIGTSIGDAIVRPILITAAGGLGAIGGAIVSLTRTHGITSKFSQMNSFEQDRLLKKISHKYGVKIPDETRKSP